MSQSKENEWTCKYDGGNCRISGDNEDINDDDWIQCRRGLSSTRSQKKTCVKRQSKEIGNLQGRIKKIRDLSPATTDAWPGQLWHTFDDELKNEICNPNVEEFKHTGCTEGNDEYCNPQNNSKYGLCSSNKFKNCAGDNDDCNKAKGEKCYQVKSGLSVTRI